MCGFCKKKYRKNNHVKIVSLFLSHYLKYEEALETNTLIEVDIENELAIINDDK